ncbi:MAG: restriction endonuclease subunit S [Treponema sp.]|nr:restriction endonuclease subunit S [Treponema sp.]
MKTEVKKRLEAIKRGEVPQGYKKTKVGIVPEEWEEGLLQDVLHLETRPVPKPDKPYWRLGLLSHAKGTFHELVENPETVQMDELYQVKDKDLVVNITFAWEHAIALAGKKDEGMLVSHRFPTFVFKKKMSPVFFGAIVMQKWFKELLVNISPGGAGRNRVMSKPAFLKLPCFIPSYSEQQKIAEIIGVCDKVIQLKESLLAEKRNLKKWLLENLLNPNRGVRLPGFKGEWEEKNLCVLCNINLSTLNENTDKNFQFYYLDLSSVNDGNISFPNAQISFENAPVRARKLFKKNDILMSTVRPYLHGFAIADFDTVEFVASTGFCILSAKKGISPYFIYYQLYSNKLDIQYNNCLVGTNYPALNSSDIERLNFFIPMELKEQEAIANILFQADDEINLLDKELLKWNIMKKALMQVLLMGIVRV